ncbi:MAG: GntR family transcriptional regulator [Betaproteobacteria bacterium]
MESSVRDPTPNDAPAPIARRSLHDQVVGRVRDLIIEGVLVAGARIHEGQLGAQLGVSRTPLREALKFLASEGLVELVASRGAIVRRFAPKDVRDMLDVLAMLEAFAARTACRVASDADIAEVRRLHDRMVERYAVRDRLEYFKLNQQIHSAFLKLAGNPTLAEAHASIQSRMKRIRYIGNEQPPKWAAALAEHEEMIVSLEKRDGDALAALVTRHLENTWARVLPTLEGAPPGDAR